jgi:6-phosphogluconolactonase
MEEWVGEQQALAVEVVAQLERSYAEAAAARGTFHIAVSGGSIASLLYPKFATAKNVDWGKVHVWWIDERAVPPTHADSNYRVAAATWFSKVSVQDHRMQGELPLPQAVDAYEADLARELPSGTMDVVLLGVGPDGHVASLFPGHPALHERTRKVLGIEDSPKPPPRRITLSLPMLQGAREAWVVATGESKAGPVHEAFEKPTSHLPLALVVRASKMVRLWMDPQAAGK